MFPIIGLKIKPNIKNAIASRIESRIKCAVLAEYSFP
jgi:hypothetical protein